MKLYRLPHPIVTVLIALASITVLVMLWGPSVTPASTRWSGLARPTAGTISAAMVAQPAATLPIDLQIDAGLYPDQRDQLRTDLAITLGYVSARFGSGMQGRVTASFVQDDGCGLRGIAYTDVRNVQVFTCAGVSSNRAVAILAHEFVHQLAQDRYGPPHLHADLILSEGVATWGAGRYWLAGKPDFRSYVREQRRNGVSYPLAISYEGLGPGGMDALYYQWASFVEYLIGTYGRDSFDRLYVSGAGEPGSANYLGIYGKDLPTLEREWSVWLEK
jgi:hypothetical protein